MSDIDDTLMCSGGHWPAGCDKQYPRKCIYPGVLAFFKELDTRQALRVQVRGRLHGRGYAGPALCVQLPYMQTIAIAVSAAGAPFHIHVNCPLCGLMRI